MNRREYMIYSIDSYETCPVTGFTDIKVAWDWGYGINTEKESFTSEGNAISHIMLEIKEALYGRYYKYIMSAKNLYDGGNGVYQTISKDQAFAFFLKNFNALFEKDVELMAKNIYAMRDRLHAILPGPKHPYYSKLRDEVIEICAFAKKIDDFNIYKFIKQEVAA